MKEIKMDEKIAEVNGKTLKNEPLNFDLTFREIKHIRRCAYTYLRIHPELNEEKIEENLSYKIIEKFKKFGEGKRRQSTSVLKRKMKDVPYVCSWKNCKEDKNLIKEHIRPISADGGNNAKNLRYLCPKHDRVRNILYILKRKEAEVKKLKEELKEGLKL